MVAGLHEQTHTSRLHDKDLFSPRALLICHLCIGTGQRIGDVLKMRWDHIKDDQIAIMQGKTDRCLTIRLTGRPKT